LSSMEGTTVLDTCFQYLALDERDGGFEQLKEGQQERLSHVAGLAKLAVQYPLVTTVQTLYNEAEDPDTAKRLARRYHTATRRFKMAAISERRWADPTM
jgi:ABC-type ATPase with predicted acetyltransferase domain